MPRLRKPLLLTLLLIAITWLAIDTSANPQRFRAQLQQLASNAIGRPVQIAGPISWTFSDGPGLRARRVSLQNPEGFSSTASSPFANAAEVQLSLSWGALLRGQLRIKRLQLDQLHIALQRAANGDDNWHFRRGKAAGKHHLDPQLAINGLTLSYQNHKLDNDADHNNKGRSHAIPELTLRAAPGQPLQLRTPLPAPLSDAMLKLQGPTLAALLADPRHWRLHGNLRYHQHQLDADLTLDLSRQRPDICGTLALRSTAASSAPATSSATPPLTPPKPQTLTTLLHAANLQLQLSSDIPGGRGRATLSLKNGLLELHADDGPQATVLQARIDSTGPIPVLQLDADTGAVDIRALVSLLGLDLGFAVKAQTMALHLHSSGSDRDALLANLRGAIKLQQLNEVQDLMDLIPQTVTLRQDDTGLTLDTSGRWAGQTYQVNTRGDPLQKLLDPQQPYTVDQRFIYGDNRQRFTGRLLRRPGQRTLEGKLTLSGSDPAQFDRLLASTHAGNLPTRLKYRISAEINQQSNTLTLDKINADIADNRITGTLNYSLRPGGRLPLLSGRLRLPRLSFSGNNSQPGKPPEPWRDYPLPALPGTLETAIELRIATIRINGTVINNLRTTITLHDHTLTLSPLTLQLADTPLGGKFSYQYNDTNSSASARLDLDNPGIEHELPAGQFQSGAHIIIKSGKGHARLRTHGRNLGHWQDNLDLSSQLTSLRATLLDASQKPLSQILLKQPVISRAPGKPVLLKARGRYNQTPLTLNAQAPLTGNHNPPPFQLSAHAGDLHIMLNGRLSAQQQLGLASLNVDISARHQRSLPLLLRSSMVTQGPYRLQGKLTRKGEHYQINNLKLRAGTNDLGGHIGIDLAGHPRKLTLTLHSHHLEPALNLIVASKGKQTMTLKDRAAGRLIPNLYLLPDAPYGWDADYQMSIDQLILGNNRIEHLQIDGKLRKQQLTLDPVHGQLNGSGAITAKMDARLIDQHLQARISARLQHLDLGFILTRDDLDNPIPWYTDIELALHGKGDYLPAFLANANGGLRFFGDPIDLDTSAMELWTLDLIDIALPGLLKKQHQQGLLCSVAGFRVNDGIMTSEGMLFDTSEATITGSGAIDLRDETLHLLLTPKKKRISLFSLATPVALLGSFSAPRASIPPSEMALTAGSVALKIVQPWIIAGGLIASGLHHNSSCAETLSNIAAKAPGQPSQHSPLGTALRQLGSDAGRLLK